MGVGWNRGRGARVRGENGAWTLGEGCCGGLRVGLVFWICYIVIVNFACCYGLWAAL